MFDDSEAALDSLLGRAAWEEPDPQMIRRLTLVLDGREEAPLAPAASLLEVPAEKIPHAAAERSAAADPVPHVTRIPIMRFMTAIAACLLLAIGIAWMMVRRASWPGAVTVSKIERPLPGRAPTPME